MVNLEINAAEIASGMKILLIKKSLEVLEGDAADVVNCVPLDDISSIFYNRKLNEKDYEILKKNGFRFTGVDCYNRYRYERKRG